MEYMVAAHLLIKSSYVCLSLKYTFGSPMHYGNVVSKNHRPRTDGDKAVHYLRQV